MHFDLLPIDTENKEHQHVTREYLYELILETEKWIPQIVQKLTSQDAITLKELFVGKKLMNGTIRLELNKENYQKTIVSSSEVKDISTGIYVFGTKENNVIVPVYIGISRNIVRRLRNHGWGKTDHQTTLLKKIHKELSHENREDKLKEIQDFYVVIIPVTEDYDLYFQEIVLSGLLKTKFNTFRTH